MVAFVAHHLALRDVAHLYALAGSDAMTVYTTIPDMQGAQLDKVFPVAHLFRHVFKSGTDITGRELRIGNRVLRNHLFTIEPGSTAGGIFSDITEPELKRDEIIEREQKVIRNNLTHRAEDLLGENAADTEMVLSSIIDSYNPPETDDGTIR